MLLFLEVTSFFIAFWAIEVCFRIIRTNPGEKTYHSFFFVGILCGLYCVFYGLMFAVREIEQVRIIYRLSVVTWGVFPLAFLVFLRRFICQMEKTELPRWFLLFHIPTVYFIIMGLSGNLLARDFKLIDTGWEELGLFTGYPDFIYLAFLILLFVYECAVLIKFILNTKDRKKRILTLKIMFPCIIALIISVISNFIIDLISPVPVPAIGHLWMGLFTIGVGYYILKVPFLKISPQVLADDILDAMTDIAVITDDSNRVLRINRPGLEYWGMRSGRVGNDGVLSIKLEEIFSGIQNFPEPGESVEGTIQLKKGDGKNVPHEYSIKSISGYFGRHRGYFIIARNAENIVNLERKTGRLESMNTRLKTLSETDSLTGLMNRLKFNELLGKEIKKAVRYEHPLSLIMIDLDDFKSVNDTWGHQTGDRVLMEVARVSSQGLREIDSLCRWGGEEFMVLCPHSDMRGTKILAERLKKLISDIRLEDVNQVTASFGISEYKNGDDAESFIKRADKRLYRAKEKGKNVVVG